MTVARARNILQLRPQGLYCPEADAFIDPLRRVDRAIITHGHSDHARPGHGAVLATPATIEIMKSRYGARFATTAQPLRYGERLTLGKAGITLLPAGHVLGSAQVLVELDGARIVVSGDYKRMSDPTCPSFEPTPCDIFITEATFGLPVFHHPPAEYEVGRLLESLQMFAGRTHHIAAYSLGKAQRLIALLRLQAYDAPIHVDRATLALCEVYASQGVRLGDVRPLGKSTHLEGGLVIAPPAARDMLRTMQGPPPRTSFASGWMSVTKRARQGGGDLPLIISDHADWAELTRTIREIQPGEVWITHGEEAGLLAWARTEQIEARPLSIRGYGSDSGTEQE
jgi:putative mRNA 3-end processing factor